MLQVNPKELTTHPKMQDGPAPRPRATAPRRQHLSSIQIQAWRPATIRIRDSGPGRGAAGRGAVRGDAFIARVSAARGVVASWLDEW
eukprot:scaffold10356_cov118-Isochrysis_galbana.AAC.4